MNNPRKAFQMFMKHQLDWATEEGMLDLSDDDIEKIIFFAEDDYDFHRDFIEFIKDYLYWNGEEIGLEDDEF
ncbi:hypothetical protein GCM10008982_17340 [Anoxybacillus voinovskiensis]|nr:hypothetical protein GCM10008982_17340 [Anoxybacillus voinovskiensis]